MPSRLAAPLPCNYAVAFAQGVYDGLALVLHPVTLAAAALEQGLLGLVIDQGLIL